MWYLLQALLAVSLLLAWMPNAFSLNCHTLKGTGDQYITYKLRQRDLRCEGFYQSNVGRPSLQLVSLTWGALNYDLINDPALSVTTPVNTAFNLRGVGIPLKLYYRLDAEIAAGQAFNLPLDVLRRENIPARSIGLFGELADKRYVPLRVNNSNKPIHMTLRASVDVSKVKWRMADVVTGNCQAWQPWADLPTTHRFRAGRALAIILPDSHAPQLCVEVAALPSSSGAWLKQLLRVQLQ